MEVTESDLVDGKKFAPSALELLALLGIRTAIDDFGTGYSSLSYLRTLCCHVLKVDRSFVRDLPTDPKASALASSIVSMAQKLGLGAVAEGVETAEQLRCLKRFGCDEIQGYLTGAPVDAEELTRLVQTGWRFQPDELDPSFLESLQSVQVGVIGERGATPANLVVGKH